MTRPVARPALVDSEAARPVGAERARLLHRGDAPLSFTPSLLPPPALPVPPRRLRALARSAPWRWLLASTLLLGLVACRRGSKSGDGTVGSVTPPGSIAVQAGCYSDLYAGAPAALIGCGILPGFDTAGLDTEAKVEMAAQSKFWVGVPAEVFPFDDCTTDGNALSLPTGFILLGTNLLQAVVLEYSNTRGLSAIIAHEWAHQAQFRFRWYGHDASTTRTSELEADAFSAYYTGAQKGWDSSDLDSHLGFVFLLEDSNFNSDAVHGTPHMRTGAGLVGLMEASLALQTGTSKTYTELHAVFLAAISLLECDGGCMLPAQLQLAAPLSIPKELAHLGVENVALLHGVAHGTRSVTEFRVTPSAELLDRSHLVLRE